MIAEMQTACDSRFEARCFVVKKVTIRITKLKQKWKHNKLKFITASCMRIDFHLIL